MFQFNNTKSFTLLEVIVAVFVITIGVVGALAAVQRTIALTSVSSSKLIAAYLAQEGIEIVRNIRDTNWLEGDVWANGIPTGDHEADYTNIQGFTYECSSIPFTLACEYDNLHCLKINSGFYNYPLGTDTKFKRRITIFDKTDLSSPSDGTIDMFKVSVLVTWQEKGKSYEISAQENLYNWH